MYLVFLFLWKFKEKNNIYKLFILCFPKTEFDKNITSGSKIYTFSLEADKLGNITIVWADLVFFFSENFDQFYIDFHSLSVL